MTQTDQIADTKAAARMAGLVIALTTVAWLAVQALGKQLGLAPRYAVLADFAAIAAYIFALVQVWRIWRRGTGQTTGRPGN